MARTVSDLLIASNSFALDQSRTPDLAGVFLGLHDSIEEDKPMGTITIAPSVTKAPADYVSEVLNLVRTKNPEELEFHQAVQEVLDTLSPVLAKHPEYQKARLLERFVEPERVVMFRVPCG